MRNTGEFSENNGEKEDESDEGKLDVVLVRLALELVRLERLVSFKVPLL